MIWPFLRQWVVFFAGIEKCRKTLYRTDFQRMTASYRTPSRCHGGAVPSTEDGLERSGRQIPGWPRKATVGPAIHLLVLDSHPVSRQEICLPIRKQRLRQCVKDHMHFHSSGIQGTTHASDDHSRSRGTRNAGRDHHEHSPPPSTRLADQCGPARPAAVFEQADPGRSANLDDIAPPPTQGRDIERWRTAPAL